MQSDQPKHSVVVGAGIIGSAISYELQKRGGQVTLIDADTPGRGASYGNMASIAVTEFMPVSRPSVWRQTPGWLLHPEGPIRVSPRYAPHLIPWFARFFWAGRPSKLRQLEAQGAALCQRSLADTENLMAELGLAGDLSTTGCLSLYASEAEFIADQERLDMLDRHGFGYEMLNRDALHDLEPEISPVIQKAVLLPDNRTVRDPYAFVTRLVEAFVSLGGQVQRGKVTGFERAERVTNVRLEDGRQIKADQVVLAAGAFTARLSKKLDEPIPLETERGYHTQINAPGIRLDHSIIWPAMAFMVSPTAGGIRVGGTVEMAGLDAAPDWRRSKITVGRARKALPNLRIDNSSEWMGHRPAFPDTVPVMSASAKVSGVYYATGHGHLGLTYAATTAKLMGQLISGELPDIDLNPYRIDRF
ncbi:MULTISPECIES: FAD-binding oxidoreductase [unclassified Ruegeria]|nr:MULTISPECIES: FAD-binding oxidoreductase [unclassified Ruegeria]NOD77557.1 FAD-dependent oxidoreductase [Ruegeria sp. HKCCD4332]NOD89762.1 FAD-dependent oxidoreductase [Ruegeria sp. HKCCD4318]NOE14792.1 FAD-dependent oxidoreductase [Ruegeria sp. HKCCD4318-2]NOG11606.1 FAD-binding oxidoreductase [Ruegeria sp. HKCCD4315]